MIKKQHKKGFSLVELIVSVSILAVLTAVLVPSFTYHQNKSRMQKDAIKFESVCTAFKTALGEPDVRSEIDEIAGGGNVQIICVIDEGGLVKFAEGNVVGTSQIKLDKTKLWLNSFQSIGSTYVLEMKKPDEQYLIFTITPKTATTTAKCEYKLAAIDP